MNKRTIFAWTMGVLLAASFSGLTSARAAGAHKTAGQKPAARLPAEKKTSPRATRKKAPAS
mgnify:CR=1 FL=1